MLFPSPAERRLDYRLSGFSKTAWPHPELAGIYSEAQLERVKKGIGKMPARLNDYPYEDARITARA